MEDVASSRKLPAPNGSNVSSSSHLLPGKNLRTKVPENLSVKNLAVPN